MVPFSPSSGSLACKVVTSVPGGTRSGTYGDKTHLQLSLSCFSEFRIEFLSPVCGRVPFLLSHLYQQAVSFTYTHTSVGGPLIPFTVL